MQSILTAARRKTLRRGCQERRATWGLIKAAADTTTRYGQFARNSCCLLPRFSRVCGIVMCICNNRKREGGGRWSSSQCFAYYALVPVKQKEEGVKGQLPLLRDTVQAIGNASCSYKVRKTAASMFKSGRMFQQRPEATSHRKARVNHEAGHGKKNCAVLNS